MGYIVETNWTLDLVDNSHHCTNIHDIVSDRVFSITLYGPHPYLASLDGQTDRIVGQIDGTKFCLLELQKWGT